MVKYSGEFVVKDIANDKQYLADLLFGWDVGDDLTGWNLAGDTVPTIASNGKLDLFDNGAGVRSSQAYYQLPNTLGVYNLVFHAKVTRLVDDTVVNDPLALLCGLGAGVLGGYGATYRRNTANNMLLLWTSLASANGNLIAIAQEPFPSGIECAADIIIAPDGVKFILNGVLMGTIPLGSKGSSTLDDVPIRKFLTINKRVALQGRHQAGEVLHVQVRDIKVGALRGPSW